MPKNDLKNGEPTTILDIKVLNFYETPMTKN